MSDPRVFFAAERTLLAWVRTAVALIGLGFLVSRFGAFLKIVAKSSDGDSHLWSTIIGVGLVVLGTWVIAIATVQHRRFVRSISVGDFPEGYLRTFSTWVALGLTVIGVLLTVYLILSIRSLGFGLAVDP